MERSFFDSTRPKLNYFAWRSLSASHYLKFPVFFSSFGYLLFIVSTFVTIVTGARCNLNRRPISTEEHYPLSLLSSGRVLIFVAVFWNCWHYQIDSADSSATSFFYSKQYANIMKLNLPSDMYIKLRGPQVRSAFSFPLIRRLQNMIIPFTAVKSFCLISAILFTIIFLRSTIAYSQLSSDIESSTE